MTRENTMPMPTIDAITAEIDAWFAERMQQPPISYSVETYNQAHAACADLKRRLHAAVTGEALKPAAADDATADPKASRAAAKA
jgi:hypothetical protein